MQSPDESRAGQTIATWLPALLWGTGAGLACAATMSLEPNLLEEGMIVHFARRMAHGEHLYRDLVFFSGPVPFEILSLLFRCFGEEIVVARSAVAALTAVSTAATFLLARRSGSGPLAHLATVAFACAPILLFPLGMIYYYSTLALCLGMPAAYAALRGLEDRRWALAAGALAALVALTKQSVGIVLGPGLVLAVACNAAPSMRRARALDVVLGGVGVAMATLAFYGLRGELGVFWHSMVVMPLSLGERFGSPYMNLWPIGSAGVGILLPFYVPQIANLLAPELVQRAPWLVGITQALYALPFLALISLVVARVTRGALPAATWIAAVVVSAFLAQLFPRSDWGHLAFVLPPSFLLLVVTAGAFGRRERRIPGTVVTIALVAAGVLGSIRIAVALHAIAGPAPLGPRVPQRAVSQFARSPALGRAHAYLRESVEPGEAIFVARAEPLLYFATGTRNPTPYGGIIPGLGEEQDRTVLEALDQVRFVAMSERDSSQLAYYRDELPRVQRYLERHFRVADPFVADWSWMLVLERGADRGPTAVDLFDEAGRAHAWIRDPAGRETPTERPPQNLGTRLNRRPLRITLGPSGGGLDFEMTVPQGAVFEADLGLQLLQADAVRVAQPRRARYEVLVDHGDGFERLRARELVMDAKTAAQWSPFEVDLSPLAGHAIVLRLAVKPQSPLPGGGVAWWGSPRIVVRRESTPPAAEDAPIPAGAAR